MPRLNENLASAIDETESGGILEPGVYDVVLIEVEARPGREFPMWTWKFEIPSGQPRAGRQFYHNTSLSEKSRWKMKEAFDAFGVPANTDTDLLVGRRCKALIVKVIAEQGKRQGQFVNQIQELMPLGKRTVGGSQPARKVDPDDPTAVRGDDPDTVTVGGAPSSEDEPPF